MFVNLSRCAPALESEMAPLAGKFAAWRLRRAAAPAPHRIRRARQLEAVLPELLGVLPLPAHPPGADPALRLPQRRQRPPEGPILGGYMAIDPRGDSLTLSGGPACPPLLGPSAGDDRRRVYYYSIFPNLFLTLLPDYAMWHALWPRGLSTGRASSASGSSLRRPPRRARRPAGRGGVLGRDQPAGLARLRAGAAGRELARLRAGALRRAGEPARGLRPGAARGAGPRGRRGDALMNVHQRRGDEECGVELRRRVDGHPQRQLDGLVAQ